MEKLKIVDVFNKTPGDIADTFNNKLNSSLRVVTNYEKVDCSFEWLEMMENTIRYLDNILRAPNRFIVNEEDVIKIELAKRVTVESIKHLSRNTNLIQDIDKKTGDVRPSKILNINKEESFDTYENRFIYSLIQNMKFYIARKKTKLGIVTPKLKDSKKFEYTASTNIGKEKVDINMTLNTNINDEKNKGAGDLTDRIAKLELHLSDLSQSEVYKAIDKLHVSLVTSPIKKTNVILKNVNFQFALTLWNYMQEHVDDDVANDKKHADYMDDSVLKDYLNETFYLSYLTSKCLNEEETPITKEEVSEKLVGNMVEQLVDLNKNMNLEELQKLVGEQFTIVKYKSVVNDKKIQEIFKDKIDKYLDRVESIKL